MRYTSPVGGGTPGIPHIVKNNDALVLELMCRRELQEEWLIHTEELVATICVENDRSSENIAELQLLAHCRGRDQVATRKSEK